jgi:hypothetical protein
MGMSFYVMLVSGGLLAIFYVLLQAESARGQRLLWPSGRNFLDSKLRQYNEQWIHWKQYVGASSFRLFLHYVLHQFLSSVLYLVRKLETGLNHLRKRNRKIAKEVKSHQVDNHLTHIAAHKASVALSGEEKAALRERTLLD